MKFPAKIRKVSGIAVTEHAVVQRLRRCGENAWIHQEQKVLQIIAYGDEVYPRGGRLHKLLNNNCKEANYYTYGGMVAVVVDNKVVTCYRFNKDEWKDVA